MTWSVYDFKPVLSQSICELINSLLRTYRHRQVREAHALSAPFVPRGLQHRTPHDFKPCATFKAQKSRFEAFGWIGVRCSGSCAEIGRVEGYETIEVLRPESNMLDSNHKMPDNRVKGVLRPVPGEPPHSGTRWRRRGCRRRLRWVERRGRRNRASDQGRITQKTQQSLSTFWGLGKHNKTVALCASDLGFGAADTYEILLRSKNFAAYRASIAPART